MNINTPNISVLSVGPNDRIVLHMPKYVPIDEIIRLGEVFKDAMADTTKKVIILDDGVTYEIVRIVRFDPNAGCFTC